MLGIKKAWLHDNKDRELNVPDYKVKVKENGQGRCSHGD